MFGRLFAQSQSLSSVLENMSTTTTTNTFPTASEAAAQARPLYMADQIRQIEEEIKKAIAAGRYRTSFGLILPAHYDPTEDAHREAAISAAFPTYGFKFGHMHCRSECSLSVSWIPAEPLPLIPPIPSAEAIFEKLHAAWKARSTDTVGGGLPLPLANVTVAQRGKLLAEIRECLGALRLSSELVMGADGLEYRLWEGESGPDEERKKVIATAIALSAVILQENREDAKANDTKGRILPIRLAPDTYLCSEFIAQLRLCLAAEPRFSNSKLDVVTVPGGRAMLVYTLM